jgi:hypothetical protein
MPRFVAGKLFVDALVEADMRGLSFAGSEYQ